MAACSPALYQFPYAKMFATIKSRSLLNIFMFLVIFVAVTIALSIVIKWWNIDEHLTPNSQVPGCRNVLETMMQGSWVERPHMKQELASIERFLRFSHQEHSLPDNLQRVDKLCGNVTFDELIGRMGPLMWFRALCDPNGYLPCCYNNVCTSRSEAECKCPHCYDMRQPIHAELATWVPRDPTCKITTFATPEATCKLLHNMTIYMVGDSLIRHTYISLLSILRQGETYGALKRTATPGMVAQCEGDLILLKTCMWWIDSDTRECNNTVRLKFMEHSTVAHSNANLNLVAELIGKNNSLILFGIGIHNDYNAELVANQIVAPLFKNMSTSPWPRFVWSTVHAPGLLKTPRVPSQSRDSVVAFNARLRSIMDAHHVPVFDTFNLTDGVMGFDGVHYGGGVNGVKAQIFLNYLLQLRSSGDIPWTAP